MDTKEEEKKMEDWCKLLACAVGLGACSVPLAPLEKNAHEEEQPWGASLISEEQETGLLDAVCDKTMSPFSQGDNIFSQSPLQVGPSPFSQDDNIFSQSPLQVGPSPFSQDDNIFSQSPPRNNAFSATMFDQPIPKLPTVLQKQASVPQVSGSLAQPPQGGGFPPEAKIGQEVPVFTVPPSTGIQTPLPCGANDKDRPIFQGQTSHSPMPSSLEPPENKKSGKVQHSTKNVHVCEKHARERFEGIFNSIKCPNLCAPEKTFKSFNAMMLHLFFDCMPNCMPVGKCCHFGRFQCRGKMWLSGFNFKEKKVGNYSIVLEPEPNKEDMELLVYWKLFSFWCKIANRTRRVSKEDELYMRAVAQVVGWSLGRDENDFVNSIFKSLHE